VTLAERMKMTSESETPANAEGVGQPMREASLAAPNGYAVAEAVKGLCAAKLELIKCRDSLREQGMWMRFDEIWKQYTAEIAATDARLDALMKPHTDQAQRIGADAGK
jgi:hypothetical protein